MDYAEGLAADLQTLCRQLLERLEPPAAQEDYLVYNRFKGCRFGQEETSGASQDVWRDDMGAEAMPLTSPPDRA